MSCIIKFKPMLFFFFYNFDPTRNMYFSCFSIQIYVVSTHFKWNALTEVFLMSTYNVCFLWRNKKNIYLATPVWISWCYDKTREQGQPRSTWLQSDQDICLLTGSLRKFPRKSLDLSVQTLRLKWTFGIYKSLYPMNTLHLSC